MITLYHQDTCSQCKMAELILKQNNIEYNSCKDIEVMKSKGIMSTPVLDTGQELIAGAKAIKAWIESRK